ncbi:MAG: hypothetical protein RLZZ265_3348 [Verrucomicrobiota bacterium]|jgi:hypothetical protein
MPAQQSPPSSALVLVTGQIWEMPNSSLRIGLIGKTLVHYKHYKGTCPRASLSLASKTVLSEYLVKNKAVLAAPQPATRTRTRTSSRTVTA